MRYPLPLCLCCTSLHSTTTFPFSICIVSSIRNFLVTFIRKMGTGNHHKSVFPGVAGPMQPHPMTATATKPSVQKRGNTVTKKIRFHSVSCDDMAKQDAVFHRLDAADPEQGRKIAQRRKAIAKGKNTVGYDEYCRQIPRDKRRKRSMETPTTPDYTLDIPNKKWNGMVKAW